MSSAIKYRIFLFLTDFRSCLREERKKLFAAMFWLLAGVALGIYIGIRIGGKESPFGMFAELFHLHFAPFSHVGPDFLRFLLFSVVVALSFFLPHPAIYPAVAIFFFGKYFGQLACVVFLSDPILSALFSVLFLYLPLLLIGGWLLFRLSLHGVEFRLCNGADCCKGTWKRIFVCLLKSVVPYLFCVIFLYLIICGVIYLIVIAL